MSLKKDLKEKTSVNLVEFFEVLFPNSKTKYYELFIKIINNKIETDANLLMEIEQMLLDISQDKDETKLKLSELTTEKKILLYDYVGMVESTLKINFGTFSDFIKYNENKVIDKNDLTTYKTYEELVQQTSLANFKENEKELIRQTFRIFENENWLIIRPLTSQSAQKYGYGTKWCTAMSHDSSYFHRYSSEGMLIYIINKIDGLKVACHKHIHEHIHEHNVTFWTMEDKQIDSIQSQLPFEILEHIIKEMKTGNESNLSLLKELWGGNNILPDNKEIPDGTEGTAGIGYDDIYVPIRNYESTLMCEYKNIEELMNNTSIEES